MTSIKIGTAIWALTFLSTACSGRPVKINQNHLSEEEVIDLIDHPRKWDNKIVWVKIFPYDNGFETSYVVCFETCDEDYAKKSPFIVLTSQNRFAGYNGKRAVLIRARYSSACFYKKTICADNRFGEFTELP
jgi:hypothetical protein